MLNPPELKRRIVAARALRNIKQAQLQARLAREGFGKQELGRVERGALPLTSVRRMAIARALNVPEEWFLEENVDRLLGVNPTPAETAPPAPEGDLGRELSADRTSDESRRRTERLREADARRDTG